MSNVEESNKNLVNLNIFLEVPTINFFSVNKIMYNFSPVSAPKLFINDKQIKLIVLRIS